MLEEPRAQGGGSYSYVSESTATASAFGARVSISAPGDILALVVGREAPPHAAVASIGGKVVVDLPEARLLAVIPLEAQPALRRHPDVVLTGPVAVDADRFAHFVRLISMQKAPGADRAHI